MIVLCVTNCPPGLRGDLSKWLSEINTGVYVGRLSARVREELWDRVCTYIKNGQATMVFSTNNEQGYTFLTHNTTWKPVDFEGITLMQKPLPVSGDTEQGSSLTRGFSNASKYEKINRTQNAHRTSVDYVVIDVETTGLDYDKDRIIEIALIKVTEGGITDQFQCLVKSDREISADVEKLTGITRDMVDKQGLSEQVAFERVNEFIGDSLVIGYNVQFDVNFIQKLGKRVDKDIIIRKIKDVLHMVRRELDEIPNYKLETVAKYFSLDISNIHRAQEDCILTYKIYCELNKL